MQAYVINKLNELQRHISLWLPLCNWTVLLCTAIHQHIVVAIGHTLFNIIFFIDATHVSIDFDVRTVEHVV